jgi:hypothetical protein
MYRLSGKPVAAAYPSNLRMRTLTISAIAGLNQT